MITGKTESGFAFEIEDEALDDYELLEALILVDAGQKAKIFDVVNLLFGEAQQKALRDHVRTPSGRVSAKRMAAETMEVFKACNQAKNSLSSPE